MLHLRTTYRLIPIVDVSHVEKLDRPESPVVDIHDVHGNFQHAGTQQAWCGHAEAREGVRQIYHAIGAQIERENRNEGQDDTALYIRIMPGTETVLVVKERRGQDPVVTKFYDEYAMMNSAQEELDRLAAGFDVLDLRTIGAVAEPVMVREVA